MAIVPEDLLRLAEALLIEAERMPEVPGREALLRAAMSRAYYAVYHAALARARREGYTRPPDGYGSHEGLWDWWFVDERPSLELAGAGDRLKDERKRADYRMRETFSLTGVRTMVEFARLAFDMVRGG